MLFMVVSITGLGIFGKEHPNIGLWIVTGILPIALFLVRVHINNIPLFYGIHTAILLGVWMIPLEQVSKVFLLGNVIIYMILSIRSKMFSKTGKNMLIHPAFFFVIAAILCIWETFVRDNKWESMYIKLTFVYLVFYTVYFFIQRYLQFVCANEKSASNIPEQEMFISGIKQTGVFTVGGIFVLWLSLNLDWFSKVMQKIGQWIIQVLRVLISGSEIPESAEPDKVLPDKMQIHTNAMGEALIPEFVLEIIAKVVSIIAFIGVITFVVFVLIAIYKFLRGHFQQVAKEKTSVLQSTGDIREQCFPLERKKERKVFGGFLNNRDKVRKLFRKAVVKQKSKIIGTASDEGQLKFITAKECCDVIKAEQLKMVYEKARYSAEEITAEDVRRAKV